jgi:aryl-alcohol dehydrogenase-like predicted oxidoreductase
VIQRPRDAVRVEGADERAGVAGLATADRAHETAQLPLDRPPPLHGLILEDPESGQILFGGEDPLTPAVPSARISSSSSYGSAAAGIHQGALDEDAAAPFSGRAVELGVTFWDTANVYHGGTSEEFVGRAITRFSCREDIVLATKVGGKVHDGPGGRGLSRKAILEQLDASLRRLGTDYIDVYYIHCFDDDAPVEETMATLDDLVRAGKVRYLGASSMWAWQFAKMQHVVAARASWVTSH